MTIKQGNKVKIEYTGTLENGQVFDSSEKHGKPLEFEVGKKSVIPGFEKAVIGMKKDEEKEVTIKPEEAYGKPNPAMIKKIPKEQFPEQQRDKIQKGMVIGLQGPNGQQ